jgi:xanthine/uracil permease
MNFYMPFAYYWMTAALASDFLSHQNRMPSIYLQSPLPCKNSFRKAVALSCLLIVGKHMLSTTVAMVVLHSIFRWTSWANFLPLCVMGVLLSLIQLSLSLLASPKIVKPAHSIGWLVLNMFCVFPLMLFAKFSSHLWASVAMTALMSGLLFWLAMHRWSITELDFA